jgi:hypothetical protein
MYCEDCRVKIDGKASLCPLCHKPVINGHEKTAFPIPKPKQMTTNRFLPIFAIIFAVIMVPSIILNAFYYKSYPWSLIVFFILLYVFFFVRHTVMNQAHFRERLIGQTLFLTIIAFVIQFVIGKCEWIFVAVIPAIYMVSDILLVTRMLKFSKYAKKNIISSYILGIMGLIPVITAYACDLDMKVPSYVASGLSILLIFAVTIIFRKTIISEIKKFFHL